MKPLQEREAAEAARDAIEDDQLTEKQKLKAQMDRAYEDAKLGKEQKALDDGALREALETACECPRCGRQHRPLRAGRPPFNSSLATRLRKYAADWRDRAADEKIALEAADAIDSLERMLGDSHAETVKVQDELAVILHAAESDRDEFRRALVRLSQAVKALAKFDKDGRTYFETNTAEAGVRWRELNAAQAIVNDLIGGQAMAPEGLPRKLPGQADD